MTYNWLPDDVETYTKDEEDDIVYARDAHGEFEVDPKRGAGEPMDGRCNAVLKYTHERYGETRFCTRLPEHKFLPEGSDYCRVHKSQEALMERAIELIKHGAFAQNYVIFEKSLSPLKFIFAVEMFDGLLEQSRHDFDVAYEKRTIDSSGEDLIEESEVEVELPIPPNDTPLAFQVQELWNASLDEVKIQNMNEAVFTSGMSEKTIAKTADMEGAITDVKYEKQEHHLHLPLGRLTKDIKQHLENGGVTIGSDDDSGVVTFQKNDYSLTVGPDEESDSDESDDAEDVDEIEFGDMLPEE